MKNILIKTMVMIMMITVTLISVVYCVSAEKTGDGICYEIKNGEVIITGGDPQTTTLEIPDKIGNLPVTEIENSAFRGKDAMTKVIIPSKVKRISDYAFAECDYLNTVEIKSGCTEIGQYSFSRCNFLSDIELPDTLVSIDDYAFYGCIRLGKLPIPSSLKIIGADAFLGCESLRFDTNGNAVAEKYAEEYKIPTSFTQTGTFTFIMLAVVTILLAVVVFYVRYLIVRKKKMRGRCPQTPVSLFERGKRRTK